MLLTGGLSAVAAAPADWTVDELVERLKTDDVVEVDGAIARFDPEVLRTSAAGHPVKVLVLPLGPLNSEDNTRYRERVGDVVDGYLDWWRDEHPDAAYEDQPVVLDIIGLGVSGRLGYGPTTLLELQTTLTDFDVTGALQLGIEYELRGVSHLDEVVAPVEPDQELIATYTEQLRASDLVVVRGGQAVDANVLSGWEDKTGKPLRVLSLPAREPGAPVTVTAADLAPAFPGDDVVVVQGRWFWLAGPDEHNVRMATLMTVSGYQGFMMEREVGPEGVLGVLGNHLADFRLGAFAGQSTPVTTNPLRWLLVALPVLMLALIVFFGLRYNRRRDSALAATVHADATQRARAAGMLPDLAAGVLAVERFATSTRAAEFITRATEHYGVARRSVNADGAAALRAALECRDALTKVAALLGIPNVPGTIGQVR